MLSISFTLCCVGLVLSSPAVGMNGTSVTCTKMRVLGTQLQPHLADGFEERQRLDVSHRAADLDNHHVDVVRDLAKRRLDFVGDVRNHLHGLAQKIAAALLGDDRFVDSAGGPIVVAGQLGRSEALVVAQIQIGLGAVIGDVHFAVLVGAHRAGIDVQVGIALLEGDAETPAFQQAADRRRGHAFAQGGNHAAGYKDILRLALLHHFAAMRLVVYQGVFQGFLQILERSKMYTDKNRCRGPELVVRTITCQAGNIWKVGSMGTKNPTYGWPENQPLSLNPPAVV